MKNQEKKILVIGSSGQIGTELVEGLRTRFGNDNVVSSDIKEPQVAQSGPFAMVNAMDRRGIERIIDKYEIMSHDTCERCGDRGTATTDGWIKVLCRRCKKQDRIRD